MSFSEFVDRHLKKYKYVVLLFCTLLFALYVYTVVCIARDDEVNYRKAQALLVCSCSVIIMIGAIMCVVSYHNTLKPAIEDYKPEKLGTSIANVVNPIMRQVGSRATQLGGFVKSAAATARPRRNDGARGRDSSNSNQWESL